MTLNPNPSLVLNKIDDITFETLESPVLTQDDEVLVQVKKTGICGSDIHYFKNGKIGNFVLRKPMVLGHESSGVVAAIGKNVKTLKVGDKVAIEPGVPSRYSEAYKSGHYNLCPDVIFAATPPANGGDNPPGTLCKYYKSPEDFLFKLPENVSLELGAMVEPLSVGVHAARMASITVGDVVVIFGAGPVGLLASSVATKFGASKVMLVDVFDSKLAVAKEINCVTHTFNSKIGGAKEILAELGEQPTVVLECSGAEPCIQIAVEILMPAGRFTQVGNCAKPVSFPMTEFATKELVLFGSFRYGYNDYKTSIAILEENYRNGKQKAKINFERLITHRFKFEDAIEAYNTTRAGNGVIKCIIDGPE